MKWTLLTLLGLAAATDIKADGDPPEGCHVNFQGKFTMTSKTPGAGSRAFINETVMCGGKNTLVMRLENSVLRDAAGRVAYIADNFQLQFDNPPQAGAIITSGFSLCKNGSLALGSSAFHFGCVSGNFSNLYNKNWAEQCSGNELVAIPCDDDKATDDWSDDAVPVCQINDGQIQVHTTPCETSPPRPTPTPPPVQTTSAEKATSVQPTPQVPSFAVPSPSTASPPGRGTEGVTPAPPAPTVPSNTTQQPSKPPAFPVAPHSPTRPVSPSQAPEAPQATTPAPAAAAAAQSLPGTSALFVAALGAVLFL